MRRSFSAIALLMFCVTPFPARAVELLSGGDFEPPGGQEIPGWSLQQFATGSGAGVNSAEQRPFGPFSGELDLWLRAFEGGEAVGPNNLTNAILSQTVPGVAGETYTFSGYSRWEINYSGGFNTLTGGPLIGQPSPTQTNFELAFLDAGGSVIGTPVTLDLRTEQNNFDNWVQHTLMNTAPAQTASVRVTAEARDMVFNMNPEQSAFFDTFTLKADSDAETELLLNADLEEVPPPFDPAWVIEQTDFPVGNPEIIRSAGFANRPESGGGSGVWLSAFFGQSDAFSPDPVDGTISQTVPAVEGGSYNFTGWSRFEVNYGGGLDTTPTETLMELAFLDGTETVIGDPIQLDLKADRTSQSPTSDPNDSAWYQHTLSGVAPTGAVSARVSGIMIDGVNSMADPQSAFFDDFSLDGPMIGGGVAGDFNNDGVVNAADYTVWRNNLDSNTALSNDGGLGVPVGPAHFDLWKENYGNMSGGGSLLSAAVPEPATLLMTVAGLLAGALCSRRASRCS